MSADGAGCESDLVGWLRRSPLFAQADAESLRLMSELLTTRSYGAGERLFEQGDVGDDVYLVTRGWVEIWIDQTGRRVATDQVTVGGCVGEMAALTGRPRSATVVAGEPGVDVVVIPAPRFRDLLLVQPAVGVGMLVMMSERLRQSDLRRRTAELVAQADELGRSQQQAEQALRSRTDFFASMSHELRTPLHGLLGLTEVLLNSRLSQTQREYLELIRDAGESLVSLVNDLLDLAKSEAGRLELVPASFDLRVELAALLKPLAVRAHRKGIDIGFRVDRDVPRDLWGDVARIRQIVVNLVGNAIKFTERGEVRLEVGAVRRGERGVELSLSVRDTGMGISREQVALLGRPYVQGDQARSGSWGGTGLGLALVKTLAELMGGSIGIASELGVGTCIQVVLGLKVADELPSFRVEGPSWRGRRVLLVHASDWQSRCVQELLAEWDMGTEVAEDCASAERVLEGGGEGEWRGGFLLLDGRLPDGLGCSVRWARSRGVLPVLLLRTDQIELAGECERCGVPWLFQPVGSGELREILARGAAGTVNGGGEGGCLETERCGSEADRTVRGRVLLADDNAINRRVAQSLLAAEGCEVVVVEHGRAALEVLAEQSVDLALMDVLMPEMDGVEVALAWRARELAVGRVERRVPIIAMTAHDFPEEVRRCLLAGMDGFLRKPASRQQLREVLDEWMRRRDSVQGELGWDFEGGGECVVNWPAALVQAEGQLSLLLRRTRVLLEELPRMADELSSSIQLRDRAGVRRVAHMLAATVAQCAAPRLERQVRSLSAAACRWPDEWQGEGGMAELMAGFAAEFRRVLASLRLFADGPPPARPALKHRLS
ncbi:MAG: ATP-binding protein [Pirellulales bacterium]